MKLGPILHRRGALVVSLLVIVGVGLLGVSFTGENRATSVSPTPHASPRPSATWGPLPTRAPDVPAAPQPTGSDLWQLHRALLRGETTVAQRIWESEIEPLMHATAAAREVAPSEIVVFVAAAQRAGARL
ncbi:MAG: hypothetical protein ACP5JG_12190, partial [Anaerolineae bacterium]